MCDGSRAIRKYPFRITEVNGASSESMFSNLISVACGVSSSLSVLVPPFLVGDSMNQYFDEETPAKLLESVDFYGDPCYQLKLFSTSQEEIFYVSEKTFLLKGVIVRKSDASREIVYESITLDPPLDDNHFSIDDNSTEDAVLAKFAKAEKRVRE